MGFLETFVKWGWPVLWLVFGLTLFDAWYDHRELSRKIEASIGTEKTHAISRRMLKWLIPVLAFLGALMGLVSSDLNDKKVSDLELRTASRSLSSEEQDIIQKELGNSTGLVYCVVDPTVPDGLSYANSICHFLQKCGYGVIPSLGSMSPMKPGITIQPNDLPQAIVLRGAFRKAHIACVDGPGWGGGFGNLKKMPEGTIIISIGARDIPETDNNSE